MGKNNFAIEIDCLISEIFNNFSLSYHSKFNKKYDILASPKIDDRVDPDFGVIN